MFIFNLGTPKRDRKKSNRFKAKLKSKNKRRREGLKK